jgi:hypothetical protein
LQRDGKWKTYPIGRCLTGVTDLELSPNSSVTFQVAFPQSAEWQAVKVSFGQIAGWSKDNESTTTMWSTEFTREAIERFAQPK